MIESVRTRRAFAALSRSRNRGRSGPVWVVRADEGTDGVQVAYAVSRAVGGAVIRNRIRRRLRALVAELERDAELSAGTYLVGVTPAVVAVPFATLRTHLAGAITGLAPVAATP